MRTRWAGYIFGIVLVALVAGCVKRVDVKPQSGKINRVALVSLSVTNWGGSATGTSGTTEQAAKLIESTLSGMLAESEKSLARVTQVSRASGFVSNAGYRSLNIKGDLGAMVPKVNGTPMAVFAKDNNELITASLSPDAAKKLCAELKVDAVVVVYSEWSNRAQSGFVPLKRAWTKNVVSVWERSGNVIFNQRVDELGEGVLGGPYGPVVVNEGTIKQWAGAYNAGFAKIVDEMKTTLKM